MRSPLLLAALAAAAVLVSACGSEAPEPEPGSPSSPAPSSPTHGALAQCLSDHGVPAAPGPTAGPPPGVDPATWQKAMQECSTLEPGPAAP
jgi:hypothetical protein